MPSYQVYCNDCETECSVMTFEGVDSNPLFCMFCGTELDDSNVREESDPDSDEDAWDKLSEESLDDIDDWK